MTENVSDEAVRAMTEDSEREGHPVPGNATESAELLQIRERLAQAGPGVVPPKDQPDRPWGYDSPEDLAHRFEHHAPDNDRVFRHGAIRDHCLVTATMIVANCRQSRERSLALTKLEEAMFWANAAIARER